MLRVPLTLPFAWLPEPDPLAGDPWRETRLVLRVALHQDSSVPPRESDKESGLERLEAKMDLILHLLARREGGGEPDLSPTRLELSDGGLSLPADFPRGPGGLGERGLCLLGLGLPLPARLAAEVVGVDGDGVHLRWLGMPEADAEAWSTWLFRQHRRAVHAMRDGP